jgi:hypothetical protein
VGASIALKLAKEKAPFDTGCILCGRRPLLGFRCVLEGNDRDGTSAGAEPAKVGGLQREVREGKGRDVSAQLLLGRRATEVRKEGGERGGGKRER